MGAKGSGWETVLLRLLRATLRLCLALKPDPEALSVAAHFRVNIGKHNRAYYRKRCLIRTVDSPTTHLSPLPLARHDASSRAYPQRLCRQDAFWASPLRPSQLRALNWTLQI